MIPEGIRRELILGAMQRIDREGVPPGRDGWKFEVRHEGRVYPPKLLISFACEAAFGRELPSGAFSGGAETNGFLQGMGFTVARKGGDVLPNIHAHQERRIAEPDDAPHKMLLSQEQLNSLKQELLFSAKFYTWKDLRKHDTLPPTASGVYAWFFRSVPAKVPSAGCLKRDGKVLLYVGISPGRRGSRETLRTRLRFHYEGHAEGSTLRLTLGCLLENQLGTVLRCSGKRMIFGTAEERLSEWMAENTAVTWVEVPTPRPFEEYLLRTLDFPLNIEGNRNHPFCDELRAIRDKARTRAEKLPNLKPR